MGSKNIGGKAAMKHECEHCGHDFAREPQKTHHCDPVAVRERERQRAADWLAARAAVEWRSGDASNAVHDALRQAGDAIARGDHAKGYVVDDRPETVARNREAFDMGPPPDRGDPGGASR